DGRALAAQPAGRDASHGGQQARAGALRRGLRRALRPHARVGMAPVPGRGDGLGAEALLRDHLRKGKGARAQARAGMLAAYASSEPRRPDAEPVQSWSVTTRPATL